MKTLILPGRSVTIKNWAIALQQAVQIKLSADVTLHEYRWWVDESIDVVPEAELERLSGVEPDTIIAKSLGTLLTAMAVQQQVIRPRQIVFLGVPVNGFLGDEPDMLRAMVRRTDRVLVIQQAQDMAGSFAQVEDIFGITGAELMMIPGDDHLYSDLETITTTIADWSVPAD